MNEKQRFTILVIKKEPVMAELLYEMLSEHGYSVVVFEKQSEALDSLAADDTNYDLIITSDFLDRASSNEKNVLMGADFIKQLLFIQQKTRLLVWGVHINQLKAQFSMNNRITLLDKSTKTPEDVLFWVEKIRKKMIESSVYQLIYLSKVVKKFEINDLTKILIASRKKNKELGITGAMLCQNGYFLQVLEGEKSVVDELFYDHIAKDERHCEVSVLEYKVINERKFQKWDMAFFYGDKENLSLFDFVNFDTHPLCRDFIKTLTQSQKDLLQIPSTHSCNPN